MQIPYQYHVQAQVKQLGNEPSLLQDATVLLKQSAKCEHESRQARQLQQQQQFVILYFVVYKNLFATETCHGKKIIFYF